MKHFLLLTIGGLLIALQPGCTTDGVAYDGNQRMQNFKEQAEMDARMLNDDIDLLLLNERPSRLSRFRVP